MMAMTTSSSMSANARTRRRSLQRLGQGQRIEKNVTGLGLFDRVERDDRRSHDRHALAKIG